MDAAVARYPDSFAGALTFDYAAEDIEAQVASYRKRPGMLAGRNLVANAATAELRPEFHAGKFERLWAAAEKYDLPLFFSTHGHADVMAAVAARATVAETDVAPETSYPMVAVAAARMPPGSSRGSDVDLLNRRLTESGLLFRPLLQRHVVPVLDQPVARRRLPVRI